MKPNANKNSYESGDWVFPDLSTRLWGFLLMFLGFIGCVVTVPLFVPGWGIGFISGLIVRRDPFDSGLLGAKVGSLGFLQLFLLGIQWVFAKNQARKKENRHTEATLEEQQLHSDWSQYSEPENVKSAAQKLTDPSNTVYAEDPINQDQKEKSSSIYKSTQHVDFNKLNEFDSFMSQVNELIRTNEAHAETRETNSKSYVKEKFIKTLIDVIKNSYSPDYQFWGRLDQMSEKDIHLFVSQLSTVKESKFGSSELDCLWRRFNKIEYEPLRMEARRKKFALILDALSEEQVKASFDSRDFLNLLHEDLYVETMGNTLNANQLALFAANRQRENILALLIRKLKPDVYLLGKLMALMPYATEGLRKAFTDQLTHLAFKASFNIELTRLLDHYLDKNLSIYRTSRRTGHKEAPVDAKKTVRSSKWAIVKAEFRPVYAPERPLQKAPCTEDEFAAFLHDLDSPSYHINENKLLESVNKLFDDQVKQIPIQAAAPDYKNMLSHFWSLESRPLNHLSYTELRENRLKIILENLSEEQLKSSLMEEKFWEIFRNRQQPFCEMAARVLTPEQFKIIIAHSELERHTDFAQIIFFIKKDTEADRVRVLQIIDAILPYTSPWIALALEIKIKDLIVTDKTRFEHYYGDLSKQLRESMNRKDISLKYHYDTHLNKHAISALLDRSPLYLCVGPGI